MKHSLHLINWKNALINLKCIYLLTYKSRRKKKSISQPLSTFNQFTATSLKIEKKEHMWIPGVDSLFYAHNSHDHRGILARALNVGPHMLLAPFGGLVEPSFSDAKALLLLTKEGLEHIDFLLISGSESCESRVWVTILWKNGYFKNTCKKQLSYETFEYL